MDLWWALYWLDLIFISAGGYVILYTVGRVKKKDDGVRSSFGFVVYCRAVNCCLLFCVFGDCSFFRCYCCVFIVVCCFVFVASVSHRRPVRQSGNRTHLQIQTTTKQELRFSTRATAPDAKATAAV